VILRRTLIGLLGETTRDLLEEIAALLEPILEWSEGQTAAEVQRTAHALTLIHGVTPAQLNR
jgi:glycerol-3-phosphate dehydrogenase